MVDHILMASLERNLIVAIMYLKNNEITMRNIRVLEIKQDRIIAYCYLRGENRVFKKENILSAAFLNTSSPSQPSYSF
ncbi:hypothetical protein [Clostridium swellfunianum]|uniref:hypothetical protein n=1 Tax=Clostridium swellfunianum TaxID=1367462 RepID=UPI002030D016|nr:hypothetical protein [Clostridium swellfunianum]